MILNVDVFYICLDVQLGDISLLFTSPEALLAGERMQLLRRHQKKICLLAFDEVHCLSEW